MGMQDLWRRRDAALTALPFPRSALTPTGFPDTTKPRRLIQRGFVVSGVACWYPPVPGEWDDLRMPRITVSIPCFRSPATIRRAVEAVLGQTHQDLVCIVTNDGDHQSPPWPHLDDIDDPRLVRFDLPDNRGRYFADAVTLGATSTSWWTVHDADDAARPNWLEAQLEHATATGASAVFCSQMLHRGERHALERPFDFTGVFEFHAHMAGLWRTDFVRELGGPHPGFRVAYDTMLTGVAMATGRSGIVDEVLYDRHIQSTSLTQDPRTTFGSALRLAARGWIEERWARATDAARLDARAAGTFLRSETDPQVLAAVDDHVIRLRELL